MSVYTATTRDNTTQLNTNTRECTTCLHISAEHVGAFINNRGQPKMGLNPCIIMVTTGSTWWQCHPPHLVGMAIPVLGRQCLIWWKWDLLNPTDLLEIGIQIPPTCWKWPHCVPAIGSHCAAPSQPFTTTWKDPTALWTLQCIVDTSSPASTLSSASTTKSSSLVLQQTSRQGSNAMLDLLVQTFCQQEESSIPQLWLRWHHHITFWDSKYCTSTLLKYFQSYFAFVWTEDYGWDW